MIQSFRTWVLAFCLLAFVACEEVNPNFQAEAQEPEFVHATEKNLTDIIVHDIFSPPVASRIYAYSNIAAYEAARHGFPGYKTLAGQLTDLKDIPEPESGKEYCFPLAGMKAFLKVGKTLIFSEDQMDAYESSLMEKFHALQIPQDVFDRSVAYGEQIGAHIMSWADGDMYKQTRTYPKFSINEEAARWQPTPPDYMDGIEPHWSKIRPFVIKSPDQFMPPPPTPYDTDPNSQFYKETMEVYEALKGDDEAEVSERTAIAKFWDCNPYVSHHTGHVMFATKKITPGGHWMGIAGIACKTANADFMKSIQAYTMTAIALADGFISCWDEKYRSNLVRPETVINRHIDENWTPTLQTPPFPEYTSGHSVISRAAAVALTSIFGDNFAYHDNVEEEYGLPARDFNSFMQASSEAAVSRLYGGIHYRPAIDNGVAQGEKVGKYVVEHITMKAG
ncbi:MAG: vanadium-dependent haloperoxidase [Saprospiraceae bacterium]